MFAMDVAFWQRSQAWPFIVFFVHIIFRQVRCHSFDPERSGLFLVFVVAEWICGFRKHNDGQDVEVHGRLEVAGEIIAVLNPSWEGTPPDRKQEHRCTAFLNFSRYGFSQYLNIRKASLPLYTGTCFFSVIDAPRVPINFITYWCHSLERRAIDRCHELPRFFLGMGRATNATGRERDASLVRLEKQHGLIEHPRQHRHKTMLAVGERNDADLPVVRVGEEGGLPRQIADDPGALLRAQVPSGRVFGQRCRVTQRNVDQTSLGSFQHRAVDVSRAVKKTPNSWVSLCHNRNPCHVQCLGGPIRFEDVDHGDDGKV